MSGGSGRFHILSEPTASPGKCGVCGTADTNARESFLDLGLTFEYYGVLYFCNECVLNMAHEYGFVTPEEASALNDKINDLGAELVRLKSRLAASEAYIASVFSVDAGSLVSSDDPESDDADSVDEERIAAESEHDSGSAKSSDEPRSDDLRYPDGSAVGSLSL